MRVDEVGRGIMLPKTRHYLIEIDSLSVPAANIIKQELLSVGGDAALDKRACDFSVKETPCLLIGTEQQLTRLIKKLGAQPFGLKKIAKQLKQTLDRYQAIPPSIVIGKRTFDFSKAPFIVGILNMTPDSFSGDGLHVDIDKLLRVAEQFVEAGADLFDVGGESTHPDATTVETTVERKRVIPAVKALAKRFRLPISIDTSKAVIAEEALEAGAHWVNDVSGFLTDSRMVNVVKKGKVPAILMHPSNPGERNPMESICRFFEERMTALEDDGIERERLILDPGIGFGKNPSLNLLILKRLEELKIFQRPILLGTSRKSFIGKITGASADQRVSGSVATAVIGFERGAHFFRVHDVRETREALLVAKEVRDAAS